MANAYERHDISDESGAKMELLPPGRKGIRGGNARDNRQFINAVFWILRTGAPWRDLPPSYGDRKNTHRRFCRWRDRGVRENLLEELIDNSEFELLMIDAGHIKVHPHGSGACGGDQNMAKTKGGSIPGYIWPWMRMACRSESLLQKVPRMNRKIQCEYDKELYQLRHWAENAFLVLKRWRGIATRYAKNTASFLAAVQIRCIAAWI